MQHKYLNKGIYFSISFLPQYLLFLQSIHSFVYTENLLLSWLLHLEKL